MQQFELRFEQERKLIKTELQAVERGGGAAEIVLDMQLSIEEKVNRVMNKQMEMFDEDREQVKEDMDRLREQLKTVQENTATLEKS